MINSRIRNNKIDLIEKIGMEIQEEKDIENLGNYMINSRIRNNKIDLIEKDGMGI
jgi:hypothetical protein